LDSFSPRKTDTSREDGRPLGPKVFYSWYMIRIVPVCKKEKMACLCIQDISCGKSAE